MPAGLGRGTVADYGFSDAGRHKESKLSRQNFANVEPTDAVCFTHRRKGARYADLVALGYSREYLASNLTRSTSVFLPGAWPIALCAYILPGLNRPSPCFVRSMRSATRKGVLVRTHDADGDAVNLTHGAMAALHHRLLP